MQKLIAITLQNDGVEGVEKYIKDEIKALHKQYFYVICLFIIVVVGAFCSQASQYDKSMGEFKERVLTQDMVFRDSLQGCVDNSAGDIHILSGKVVVTP